MKSIISSQDNNRTIAALKLIEYIYHCGMIQKHIYHNVLNEFSDRVDITQFTR